MLIPRDDGVLEWRPDPPPVVLNAEITEHMSVLENGVIIRMICHWGEIKLAERGKAE